MTEEQMQRTIATVSDGDHTYQAFLLLLQGAADTETAAALTPGSDPYLRAYDCGRASALKGVLDDIETIRAAVRRSD